MPVATDKWRCLISDDAMTASVFVTQPGEGESITVEDVTLFLRANGVLYGLVYSEIEKLIKDRIYLKDVVVAKGRSLIETQNGYYEFLFSMGEIKHPAIRSDGSVDYQSMSVIPSVVPGDVLAIYHPSIPGSSKG